jgi:hypothetical protein
LIQNIGSDATYVYVSSVNPTGKMLTLPARMAYSSLNDRATTLRNG